jgi:hypothetical protein
VAVEDAGDDGEHHVDVGEHGSETEKFYVLKIETLTRLQKRYIITLNVYLPSDSSDKWGQFHQHFGAKLEQLLRK